jgi:hypothetical protein
MFGGKLYLCTTFGRQMDTGSGVLEAATLTV